MLKHLVAVRLASLKASFMQKSMRRDGRHGKGMRILFGFLFAYLGVCLLVMVGAMCSALAPVLAQSGLAWVYHGLIGMSVVGFCFVGSVFLTQSQLFESRDNELLLSMPIPARTIVASRLLSLLFLNYIYTAIIMVPAAVMFVIHVRPGFMFYLSYIVGFLLLPLLSMTLPCLVGSLITLDRKSTRLTSRHIQQSRIQPSS